MGFSKEEKEVKSAVSRWMWWGIGTIVLISIIFGIINRLGKVVDVDKGITTYENFYQMHDQAEQICNDISVMQGADEMSGGFSKTERIIGLENKLNDVIRDYNAQSKAWTKSMWKSSELPYTISRSDFNCN